MLSGWMASLNQCCHLEFHATFSSESCYGLCADSTTSDGRCGSNVYEVNTWLWNFGRGKPELHLGGLTVDETAMRMKTMKKDQVRRSVETRRSRRARADGA